MYAGGQVLFGPALTRDAVERRCDDGAQITLGVADEPLPAGHDLLFRIRADGRLVPVTEGAQPSVEDGDTTVLLGPAPRRTDPGASDDLRSATPCDASLPEHREPAATGDES